MEFYEDLEDLTRAEQRLLDLLAGRDELVTLEELKAEYGLET